MSGRGGLTLQGGMEEEGWKRTDPAGRDGRGLTLQGGVEEDWPCREGWKRTDPAGRGVRRLSLEGGMEEGWKRTLYIYIYFLHST